MIDRRQLIAAGMVGLGALALPGVASILHARGFTHGVASGEPGPGSVLLWTRYASESDTLLRVEVATDTLFRRIVAGADARALPDRDHTARATVAGLEAGRWYFYRFIAPDGAMSPVGRTRTLPAGEVARFGIGLFSCSNLPFGWFNAYAHACRRSDLDLVVHVGDYLYEYPVGSYPDARLALPGRLIQPSQETVSVADYRLRHASYRLDPDLQRLHQSYPTIVQWDDHEIANDAWVGGAENHQPDTEGDWGIRKAAAERVYREWMPVSDERWAAYEIGNLATLFKLETRISGRSAPPDLEGRLAGRTDIDRALAEFREDTLNDPARTGLGEPQERWLAAALRRSAAAGKPWQVLAQQIVMGEVLMPSDVRDWIPADAPELVKRRVAVGTVASRLGLPFNFDSWGGFPAARRRLLTAGLEAEANLIVLSGDSHNAWGQNLRVEGRPAGVEFGTHSVTSPGFEMALGKVAPTDVAAALRRTNPGLVYSDTSRRGYCSVVLGAQETVGTFHFLRTVGERSTELAESVSLRVRAGQRVLEPA